MEVECTAALTCFRKIESLLAKVGDQAKERDEASKGGTDNVEIAQVKGRHLGCFRLLVVLGLNDPPTGQALRMDGIQRATDNEKQLSNEARFLNTVPSPSC